MSYGEIKALYKYRVLSDNKKPSSCIEFSFSQLLRKTFNDYLIASE